MNNRGRHRKEKLITRVIFGQNMLQYKFTNRCRIQLDYINYEPLKLYKVYLNKNYEICRIEEDTKR